MKKLLLVDGHSLIHRAYHAYPKTLATAKGELTNATYGFTNILLTAINELAPTHAAVAFDLPKPTFREQMFVGYKQSRVKPDDDMIIQIPRIKQVVKALNIPIFEVAGFEADDVIGTLCRQATEKMTKRLNRQTVKNTKVISNRLTVRPASHFVIILTSDRDLMQLIRDDKVIVKLPPRRAKAKRVSGIQDSVFTIQNSELWNEDRFLSAWGFTPQLLPDHKALAGDTSDDIPGVRGIGEKTAKELVEEYGGIDDIYQLITQSSNLKTQNQNSKLKITDTLIKKLAEGQEDAQLSKKLAAIDTDVPIKIDWEKMEIHRYNKEKVLEIFEELQFKSLIRKLPNDLFEQSVQEVLF